MIKLFLNFFILIVMFATANPAFCNSAKTYTYKFVPIKDNKTKIEFARATVPQDFSVNSDIIWARDFEEPALLTVTAKSNKKDVFFFYSSAKSYVDVPSDNYAKLHSGKQDPTLRVCRKKFSTPEDYIFETVSSSNPNATDIKLVSSNSGTKELSEYLMSELYQKLLQLQSDAKADKRASKVKLTSPYVKPYIATYTYKINGKAYKQTFLTMFTSIDYNYTTKTNYDDYETITKKLWKNTGFYSFRAEEKDYNEFFDDFMIFVSDSTANIKAVEAMHNVKLQMLMELNPSFIDIHSGSNLKNMPSELFRRYYLGGASDYSEDVPMQKPTIQQMRWLTNFLSDLNCYNYRKITNLWRQKVYIPKKYQYVYYNTVKQLLLISQEKQKLGGTWIQLKQAKIDYSK